MLLQQLLPLRLSTRFKVIQNLPQLYKYDVWGPRKTWVKEMPVPVEESRKTLWGPARTLVWDKRQQKMIVKTEEHSPFKEKSLILRGRLARVLSPMTKKNFMEQRYRRLIWKYHNKYYLSNMAYNEDKKRELMSHVGPLALSAHLFLDKMDCAIQYERHDLPGNPKEWLEDMRAIIAEDPREINITGIDARYSLLGYEGLEQLRSCKNLKYLNASYARIFDNHCLTRLHMVGETLEYLDLSGSSVNVKGLGYLRLLPNLKWINLSNLPEQEDIERYLPYIQEIVPPGCVVIVKSDDDIEEQKLLTAGDDSSALSALIGSTSEDIRKLFKLPEPGRMAGTGLIQAKSRRNKLRTNFNQRNLSKAVKLTYYRKAAERLPPLF